MEKRTYTLIEASDLCIKYGALAEKISSIHEKDRIISVVVSPPDWLNKNLFVEIYKEIRNPVESLDFYIGSLFDVIIIFQRQDGKGEWYFKELRSFLEAYGISIKGESDISGQAVPSKYHQ